MHTVTVIQFSKQQARRRLPGGDHVCRPRHLPPALTPWWPVALGLHVWSGLLAARAVTLQASKAADHAPAKVMPMAGFKARRVS